MAVVTRPTLGGWRTRALELDGDGPVLVLLHGFGDHAGTWLPVLRELATHNIRTVALDLPGFGESDPVGAGPMLELLDDFVEAAVAHWTVDGLAPILVGNSLGGLLALRAGRDPGVAPSAVVPVSPAGFGHVWFIDLLERFSQLNPLLFTPVVPMSVFRTLTAHGYAWAAAGPSGVARGVPTAMASHFRSATDIQRIFGCAPELLKEIRASEVSPPPLLVPCLIVWGRHDRLTPVSGAKALGQQVPDAEVVILEDCGHCAQTGRPDLVAGHLRRFRNSVVGAVAQQPLRNP